jgi:DNA-binding XRE family transcriptional regulator
MGRRPGPPLDAGHPSVIAPRVRQRRQALGMTLQAVAAKAGLSNPFISQIENGRCTPGKESLERLAQALGVTTYWLTAPRPEPTANPETNPTVTLTTLPAGFAGLSDLSGYATDRNLGPREVAALIGVAGILRANPKTVDWARLHGALGPWLNPRGRGSARDAGQGGDR